MLAASYSPWLVLAAAIVALMAGIGGLRLAHGLSQLDPHARKPAIVRAAIVLGGGVWSTHFVAMLALRLPVALFYDPAYTLASALAAILMAGIGLGLLHFGPRSPVRVGLAGAVMGLGVVIMHYIGMYGMRGCQPVFAAQGYVVSTVLSVAICWAAMRLAYGRRSTMGLAAGGAAYGLAILAMHFSAMSLTGFRALADTAPSARLLPDDVLALLVMFTAFLICGAFLLTTVTVAEPERADSDPADATPVPETGPEAEPAPPLRLRYERDGRTFFADPGDVLAIQAEGHYTRLLRRDDRVFCPVAINRLAEELTDSRFVRTHRSYLVNLDHVQGFERRRDQGVCLFAPELGIEPVPVSRTHVPDVMRALGL